MKVFISLSLNMRKIESRLKTIIQVAKDMYDGGDQTAIDRINFFISKTFSPDFDDVLLDNPVQDIMNQVKSDTKLYHELESFLNTYERKWHV